MSLSVPSNAPSEHVAVEKPLGRTAKKRANLNELPLPPLCLLAREDVPLTGAGVAGVRGGASVAAGERVAPARVLYDATFDGCAGSIRRCCRVGGRDSRARDGGAESEQWQHGQPQPAQECPLRNRR